MPTPLPTTWTERNGPPTTVLLEGPIKFHKRLDNFYEGARGRLHGDVPRKRIDNFFELAGVAHELGLYFTGRRRDNFIESALR